MSLNQQYDVAVMGGGIAGITSGLRLAERGVRVAVLEKGESERYPCNTRYSGGAFHVCFHRVYDDEATLMAAIESRTHGFARKELAQAVARDTRTAVDYFKGKGIKFIKGGPDAWRESTLAPPLPPKPGLHWEGRGSDVFLDALTAAFAAAGGTLATGAAVKRLRMGGVRCIGVEVEHGGKRQSVDARAVILCDGGFQANHALLREFITAAPEKLKQRGAATGNGDALLMAREVGAGLVGMDKFYGHLLAQEAMHNDSLWPFPMLDHICVAAIVVDGGARRFADEGLGGVYITNQVARLADPLSAVVIFDERIWNGPAREFILPANPNLLTAGATLLKAESLVSLAGQVGFPAGALERTVAEYNSAVESEQTARLSPPRTTSAHKAYPIVQGPFYALRLCGGITFTMGGIATDDVGCVLNEQNAVIPGLYAAGCSTGGLEGGPNAGYVGGLAKSAALALRAADHIAASRQ